MTETEIDIKEILKAKQIEVTYAGSNNKMYEVRTETSFVSEEKITVSFQYTKDFKLSCPQKITVKFMINNVFCTAITTLNSYKRIGKDIYFTFEIPQTILEQKQRKYYRVNLRRTCVLIATDKNKRNDVYMSRLVDLSVGGLLLHQLESMFEDSYVNINPYDYETFSIVLFLDIDAVLKLSARYIRQEQEDRFYRYAFEFQNIKGSDKDTINRCVTKEQLKQLKKQKQWE